MTGRTHDLIAFTALSSSLLYFQVNSFSLASGLVALTAGFIGGLAPDLDQPTANLWHRVPAGTIFGKFLSPFLGGHRFISHSILGIFIFGFGLNHILNWAHTFLLVDMGLVWNAFIIASAH